MLVKFTYEEELLYTLLEFKFENEATTLKVTDDHYVYAFS